LKIFKIQPLLIKYLFAMSGMTVLFSQFIACGVELYQVDLLDDTICLDAKPSFALTEDRKNEDPSHRYYGLSSPNGWKTLPVKVWFSDDMSDAQIDAIRNAMATWENGIGQPGTLFAPQGRHNGVTGDSFLSAAGSLKDQYNGFYLDKDWQKIMAVDHKTALSAATTVFQQCYGSAKRISEADIRYNEEFFIMGNTLTDQRSENRDIIDLESLALHELGHFLGLGHVASEGSSVMSPIIMRGEGMQSRIPSPKDLERIQKIYGCEGLACDIDAYLEDLFWQKANES
jgi:hypothetical protein